MMTKTIAAGLAGSLLLVSAAFAAETSTTNSTNNSTNAARSDTTAASYQGDWRTSKLVGLNVYNNSNENVGSINDLLTDSSGTIKAVVIGVGGFLGMGEHLVAVSFDKVKFSDQPVSSTGASNAPASGNNNTASNNTASPSSTTTTGSTATSSSSSSSMTGSKSSRWYPDHAVFNASKDELKAMPEFKYSE